MEENYDVENEEIINIPKIMSLSNILSEEKKLKLKKDRTRNLSFSGIHSFLSVIDLKANHKFNKTDTFDKNIKNRHNSITYRPSINEKNKKVTFTNVEVIRVKNYKKYNKLNSSKKKEEEEININNNSGFNCILF